MKWFGWAFFISFLFPLILSARVGVNVEQGYDLGPDPDTDVGWGWIDLHNEIPNWAWVGRELNGGKDFHRYPYGMTLHRGPVDGTAAGLVSGQDPTHQAEASGGTMIAGTGGRVQLTVEHMGHRNSGIYINAFPLTIYGQAANYGAPYLKDGKLEFGTMLSPEGFYASLDERNPDYQYRLKMFEHIIKTNENLGYIMIVGRAGSDFLASSIESWGGTVKRRVSDATLKRRYQAVHYKSYYAGGNRAVYFPIDEKGRNIALNRGEKGKYTSAKHVAQLQKRAKDRVDQVIPINAGPEHLGQNGFIDSRQFGYRLNEWRNEEGMLGSLKGLTLSDGTVIKKDIRFILMPHPGSRSPTLQKDFRRAFKRFDTFRDEGWVDPDPDPGMRNKSLEGKLFNYGRATIPDEDFPFGVSRALIENETNASRRGHETIIFGGRGKAHLNYRDHQRALKGRSSEGIGHYENTQPWNPVLTDGDFDRGPGKEWAELFWSLDTKPIFRQKKDEDGRRMSFLKDGIAAYRVGSHPKHGAFGYHRGNIDNPEVLVLADPSNKDHDDLMTGRAMTGQNGQLLHGFMEGLRVKDNRYGVIKTVPFVMEDKTKEDWEEVLDLTREWRSQIIEKVLSARRKPKLILTMGKYAADIAREELDNLGLDIEVVDLKNNSLENRQRAFRQIVGKRIFKRSVSFNRYAKSIPRSHLPFPIQAWFGTSGQRVIATEDGTDKKTKKWTHYRGLYFASVAPKWIHKMMKTRYADLSRGEKEYVDMVRAEQMGWGFGNLGHSMDEICSDKVASLS